MKINTKKKIFVGLIAFVALLIAFFAGEYVPTRTESEHAVIENQLKQPENVMDVDEHDFSSVEPAAHEQPEQKDENNTSVPDDKENNTHEPAVETTQAPPVTEEKAVVTTSCYCTLTVQCDAVLNSLSALAEEKRTVIPENGILYHEKKVAFTEGESVFDILLREMKKNQIHFEFVKTPMYNSAYIEGIGNLYEFDCGDYSGWLYRVNGKNPNYGCSQYKVRNGDEIVFYYSCNYLNERG